jgi:hypothetical protein
MKNNAFPRFASIAGFFGLYPVLAAFARTYLHVHLPLDHILDLVVPAFVFSPPVLLLCGGTLLFAGSNWFRVIGAGYLLTLVWWLRILLTYDL